VLQQALDAGTLSPAELTGAMNSLGKMMHSIADDLPKVRACVYVYVRGGVPACVRVCVCVVLVLVLVVHRRVRVCVCVMCDESFPEVVFSS